MTLLNRIVFSCARTIRRSNRWYDRQEPTHRFFYFFVPYTILVFLTGATTWLFYLFVILGIVWRAMPARAIMKFCRSRE